VIVKEPVKLKVISDDCADICGRKDFSLQEAKEIFEFLVISAVVVRNYGYSV
jgi:hypothetical protein